MFSLLFFIIKQVAVRFVEEIVIGGFFYNV